MVAKAVIITAARYLTTMGERFSCNAWDSSKSSTRAVSPRPSSVLSIMVMSSTSGVRTPEESPSPEPLRWGERHINSTHLLRKQPQSTDAYTIHPAILRTSLYCPPQACPADDLERRHRAITPGSSLSMAASVSGNAL